ncbi:MAG: extracellular solute-binding protein [Promicromonosporaceae bacterium]|nr:extracellular solute-binding protein [Promicromonosporaceae bacterium]
MRIKKKAAAIIAAGITVAMLAGACGNGDDNGEAGPATTPTDAATNGNGGETGNGGEVTPTAGVCGDLDIDPAQMVGAMPDFIAGERFVSPAGITIPMLYRVHMGYPIDEWNADWNILVAMEERNNVHFDRTDILFDDWDGVRNMEIAAGMFPYFIPVVWGGQETGWVGDGNLLPMDVYLACMPNARHAISTWPGIEAELELRRNADGHIYNLGSFRESPNIEQSWAINVDLFEEAGAPTSWNTYAELLDAMRLVRDNTDVEYVLSERWGSGDSGILGATLNVVGPNFGTNGGWNRNVTIFDWDSDQFVSKISQPGYRAMIELFATMVEEGLLDPELTQTDDQAISKFVNGRSAMIMTNSGTELSAMQLLAGDLGIEMNMEMVVLPAGTLGHYVAGGQLGPGFVLNSDIRTSPYFVAALQFLDWLYFSDEGLQFVLWGVEGMTFQYDADGFPEILPALVQAEEARVAEADDEEVSVRGTTAIFQQDFGLRDGVWMQSWGGTDANILSALPPSSQNNARAWRQQTVEVKSILPLDPAAPRTTEEDEEWSLINAGAQSAIETGVVQFVLGVRPMSDFDAWVAEVAAAGADRMAAIQNEALARHRAG